MIHLAAALFFALAFVAAATFLHMTVRTHWREIVLALKGELGAVRQPARRRWAQPARRRHAAF